ncbi:hypothetical protein HNQ51_003708 [Inhella inkyongensis]|uniref:Uncharacterized protein n=1 Tax=Inhella inkyongensis TaxID=392593 RepID=A0A840S9Q9_9BURK|nr:hypothetical protein [Inhella inkyongensis]MBB5206362.1 hypothetical protein [Inhella inkyongensis]
MTEKQEEGNSGSIKWNMKNLILITLEAVVLVIGLWMHPVFESSPARTLT